MNDGDYDHRVFYFDQSWSDSDLYDPDRWERVSLIGRGLRVAIRTVFRRTGIDVKTLGTARQLLAPRVRRFAPDLVVYPTPNAMAFESGFPYLMAIHDVQHRLNPQFPEVGTDEIIERRSYVYGEGCAHATGILVDSETGREDVKRFYGVEDERTFILPFVPPEYLKEADNEIDEELLADLPNRFLFYPAQFWEHKNHETLFEAMALLRDESDLDVSCICVGSEKNAYERITNTIDRLELHDRVHKLGFVEDKAMYTLYKEAVALVMPTYFGPTNIPPLEAFQLGCPVITSDVHGIPEQIGDAGILVDPDSVTELAEAIESVWTDKALRETLIERGHQRAASYTQEDFNELFDRHVREALANSGVCE